jgi:hypothetical protein
LLKGFASLSILLKYAGKLDDASNFAIIIFLD